MPIASTKQLALVEEPTHRCSRRQLGCSKAQSKARYERFEQAGIWRIVQYSSFA